MPQPPSSRKWSRRGDGGEEREDLASLYGKYSYSTVVGDGECQRMKEEKSRRERGKDSKRKGDISRLGREAIGGRRVEGKET